MSTMCSELRRMVGNKRALLLALLLLGCGGGQAEKELKSDHIVEASEPLGGKWWLLPNLQDSLVVLPDRPHTRAEIEASHQGKNAVKRVRDYRLSTNSIGLRGPEVQPKKPGVIRIAALGDSVTHGWGVSREESYPAQLQVELQRRGHQVEVLNAGVPANRLDTMETWCRVMAKRLELDWILWTRRPDARVANPIQAYRKNAKECERASGAQILVVLPPVSTFDLNGVQNFQREHRKLKEAFLPHSQVLELTEVFREAQAGRGEILKTEAGLHKVVDQESGRVWLEVPVPSAGQGRAPGTSMDDSVYALFESEAEVREALFFDEGHPDAEGFEVFAEAVATAWESAAAVATQ